MGGRTHLSIGEVLGLLQADFPDLTITKIRFLESQGLIDPERTPSGYRKFYDFDIERLRWILRQQRENFLPLKVIKDRLDGADGQHSDQAEPPTQEELDLARDPGAADPPPVWMADHARVTAGVAVGAEASAPSHQASEPTAGRGASAPAPGDEPPAARPAAVPVEQAGAAGSDQAEPAGPERPPTAGVEPGTTPADRPKEARMSEPKTATSAASGKGRKVPRALDLGESDVSMSRGELLSATGLTEAQLSELEGYALVTPAETNPDSIYGAEALVCARHAATFFSLGVEARHLRAFKVAADREAGLYEQLILPLLRQRNPAARQEAGVNLDRLATAGAAMHAALLHQALRPHLNSRPEGRR